MSMFSEEQDMTLEELTSLVDEYCQLQYYNHVERACEEYLSKQQDIFAEFWHAFALDMQGSHTQALREMKKLKSDKTVSLAATAALIAIHKNAKSRDKEEMKALRSDMSDLSKNASADGLVFASRYFVHSGKPKQAKQCIDKVLRAAEMDVDKLNAAGLVYSQPDFPIEKAYEFFEGALELSRRKPLASLFGRAKCYMREKDFIPALKDLNQVVVRYTNFPIGLVEKARVLMIQGNWDESMQTVERVLLKQRFNIDALMITVAYMLVREGGHASTLGKIQLLSDAIQRHEPKNHGLYYQAGRLCARLCNRNMEVLSTSMRFIKVAMQIDPTESDYIVEQAYVLTLMGSAQQAEGIFEEASRIDEANMHAMYGKIKCKILTGNYEGAQNELDFLAKVGHTNEPQTLFLEALVASRTKKEDAKAIRLLTDCLDMHIHACDKILRGFDYYIEFNPDFVLEVITELSKWVGTECIGPDEAASPLITKVGAYLLHYTEILPGVASAMLMYARVLFLMRKFDKSERALEQILELDAQCAEAHMIQAQISVERKQFKEATQALEMARSLDFKVQTSPKYLVTKAKVLYNRMHNQRAGQEEALQVLKDAMAIPGIKKHDPSNPHPISERVNIFIELGKVHTLLGNLAQAKSTMSVARLEFDKTAEKARLIIADVDFSVLRGEYDRALNLLKGIDSSSVYYMRGKQRVADIYLKHKKNKKAYALQYQEIAYESKTPHSFVMLGEAYMEIAEPEKAIDAYKQAIALAADDISLVSKIGVTLVMTHQYEAAKQHYLRACKQNPAEVTLFTELADLHIYLQDYDAAMDILEHALSICHHDDFKHSGQVKYVIGEATCYRLQAQVYEETGATDKISEALSRALESQKQVLAAVRGRSNPDVIDEQKRIACDLCILLAKASMDVRKSDDAIVLYNDALKHVPENVDAHLALAKIHLVNNEVDLCTEHCQALLKMDSANQEATMLLSDIMFRNNEQAAAVDHFRALLKDNPSQYPALEKLVKLLYRSGRIYEVDVYLKKASLTSPQEKNSSGFCFVKGLYSWLTADPQNALALFNKAKNDAQWGYPAQLYMVQIYLNPDNDVFFLNATDTTRESKESTRAHLRNAQKLLRQMMFNHGNDPDFIVLQSYHLIAQGKAEGKRDLMEQAASKLKKLVADDNSFIPGWLALASFHLAMNQGPKAKNNLKRISKMKHNPEYDLEFERAWLMLADMYITAGKFDLAQDLCRKALANNKGSSKAWEQLGLIMEKEASYRDAAEHYERAWQCMNASSAAVGYKLAFNYLKAQRFVEAISVCHQVLEKFPNYPKIKKDILDKARIALRP